MEAPKRSRYLSVYPATLLLSSFVICIFIALFIPETVFDTRLFYSLQSTLSKTDAFRMGTMCPSYRETDKGIKKGGDQFKVSVKRESTVFFILVELFVKANSNVSFQVHDEASYLMIDYVAVVVR